jgi:hypothetical protein
MKVLDHFLCILFGFGMHSGLVYCLNHDTITSFGLHLTPIFQKKKFPTYTGIIV